MGACMDEWRRQRVIGVNDARLVAGRSEGNECRGLGGVIDVGIGIEVSGMWQRMILVLRGQWQGIR